MTYATVLAEVTDGIALITINLPEDRNAVIREGQADIRADLDDFWDDDAGSLPSARLPYGWPRW